MIAALTLNVSIDRHYVVSNDRHGAVNRVAECTYTAGGKGLNVARVIHALGEDVVAGGIAGGYSGQYIRHCLDEEGIQHRFTLGAGESRSCINISDMATGAQTEYLEPGMQVSEAEYEAFLRDFDELTERCDVLTMSGSLPKGLASNVYAKLISHAAAVGKKVLLDTSGAALTDSLDSKPYYIKPNEDEIKMLTGCDIQDEKALADAALRVYNRGVRLVTVSMGSRGAMLVCAEGVIRGVPPKIRALNTVGCGDSMTAAFAVAVERGLAPKEAMRFAIAVSAASALNEGTGGLRLSDLEQIQPGVQVYSL